jgi:hypothetical protein
MRDGAQERKKSMTTKTRKRTEHDRPLEWMPRKGDTVDYHSIIGEPATSFNHQVIETWISNAGYPVSNITGIRGFVSCDALTPALVLVDPGRLPPAESN